MTDYGFCRKCGKVKEKKLLPFCNACNELYYHDFAKIKAYLKKYPGANALKIAQETEVEIEKILYFIKNGVIQVKNRRYKS